MDVNILSVSQITRSLKNMIEGNFYNVWVEGEVSGVKYHSSGHVYFSLVDEFASIRAVIYRSRRHNLSFELKNGMKIVVFGSVGVYEKGGYYQIVVEVVEEYGLGKKFEELEKIKNEFRKKGYFDRKREVPLYPGRILIVTSTTGAAIRDMLNILMRKMLGVEVLIYPVTVQGEHASESIISALEHINTLSLNVDCLVLARGGGSMEDLWVFNDPRVALALFNSKYPTISAIGHEVDTTLCDYVADKRAETPSSAMEMLLKNRLDLLDKVSSLRRSIESYVFMILKHRREKFLRAAQVVSPHFLRRRIDAKCTEIDSLMERLDARLMERLNGCRRRVEWATSRLISLSPEVRLEMLIQRLMSMEDRMFSLVSGKLSRLRGMVDVFRSRVKGSDPFSILSRGYSITVDDKGRTIKSIRDVSIGERIGTLLKDGKVLSTVNAVGDGFSGGVQH